MERKFDAVVVGAGSAGAAAAIQLARLGLATALVEQQPLAKAGAGWVNGIAPWMFERARLPLPERPELVGRDAPFHLHAADGRPGVRLAQSPVWQVDMRRLVDRLHGLAARAGVTVLEHRRADALELEHGRAVRLRVAGGRAAERLHARLFVDASGIRGRLRRQHAALRALCPPPLPADICTAAQEVRRVADAGGARAFLARHGARSGAAMCFVGVDGGYSTLVVTVDLAHGTVDLLTGAVADGAHATGPELVAAFCAREPWVGPVERSGSGAVPLRHAYARLAAPGLALVGDSACQVFPAHGSGVGTGLVAGRLLAEAIGREADPGCAEAMHRYQAAYMREIGRVCAAYDVVRRFSAGLDAAQSAALVTSGLTTRAMAEAALAQRMARPRLRDLPAILRGALRAPRLALRLAPVLARMQAVHALYARHPRRDGAAMRGWLRFAAGGTLRAASYTDVAPLARLPAHPAAPPPRMGRSGAAA